MKLKSEFKKMSVDDVKRIFINDSIDISTEDAECILDFLNNYTLLVIKEYFDI